MLYNIDFEIVAFLFVSTTFILHKIQYTTENILNKIFVQIEIWSMIMIFTDVVSALGITYYEKVPYLLNMTLNTSNFFSLAVLAYIFTTYVLTICKHSDKIIIMPFNLSLIIAYLIICIVNYFTGVLFDFDYAGMTGYHHGPLYLLSPGITYYFILVVGVLLIKHRRELSRREMVTLTVYVALMLIFAYFQIFVLPRTLMTGVGCCLAIIIILFSLETPDYVKLQKTMTELEKSREDAEQANKAKSDFLANMSHEIRTPINAVMGMDEMILREAKDKDILFYAENIQKSSDTLLSIINNILDISKVESGKMDIVPEDYKLKDLITDIGNMIKVKADGKQMKFDIEADPDMPTVLYGDSLRVKQCAINILNNAVKYSSDSVTFIVKFEKKDSENGLLTMISKDTGIGIKEEDLNKLFESFTRVDLKKNRNIEGTGLGLSITSKLVHLMKGEIKVESEYGKGSVFTIEIPQLIKDATPMGEFNLESKEDVQANDDVASLVAPDKKVLIVDDTKVNLVVIKALLKRTQVQIDTAERGALALEKMCQTKYDCILLDHMMPEMDGIETLQKSRETAGNLNLDTPVIALTANAIEGAKEMYLENGFSDYLSKPVNGTQLENMLLKYL